MAEVQAGASVSATARKHGIQAQTVALWCKRANGVDKPAAALVFSSHETVRNVPRWVSFPRRSLLFYAFKSQLPALLMSMSAPSAIPLIFFCSFIALAAIA